MQNQYDDFVRMLPSYQRNTRDYDLQGYFMNNPASYQASLQQGGHFPDTYKKPNHPTFSTGSKYSQGNLTGGQWSQGETGQWSFEPSSTNMLMIGPDNLREYFKNNEPNSILNMR